MTNHIALQTLLGSVFTFSLELILLNESLALRTSLPASFGTLITTNMEIIAREQLSDFTQHLVYELVSIRITSTKHIAAYAPDLSHFVRTARAAQVGVSCKCSQHVTREVDFGNNHDVASSCIGDDVFTLLLSVKSTMRLAVIFASVFTYHRSRTMATDFGEFRQLLDFDAPTLVVGQVPVHAVDAMQSNHVNESFHTVGGCKVACYIQHRAAISEAWSIIDVYTWQSNLASLRHSCTFLFAEVRERFTKRLDAIERTSLGASCNAHCFAVDAQSITFG